MSLAIKHGEQATLRSLCLSTLKNSATNIAIIADDTGDVISYGQASELVSRITDSFAQAGLRPGDTVVSWACLNTESVLLSWACFVAGIVFVPLASIWSEERVHFVLEEVRPQLVFTDISHYDRLEDYRLRSELARFVVYDDSTEFDERNDCFFSNWISESECSKMTFPTFEDSFDNPAIMLFTSGSTGRPKGVILTSGALSNSGRLISEHFEWKADDIFLNTGELHSMSGFRNTCIAPLHASCTVLLSKPESLHPLNLPHHISKHSCTLIGLSPLIVRMLNTMSSHFSPELFSTLRAVICTGEFLHPKQVRQFYDNTDVPILNYYGLTETSGLCCGHDLSTFDPEETSIGKAIGAELEIVDENDDPLPDGEPGQLRIRGPNLMKGYFKKPFLTSKVLIDGWFYTGDIAMRRPDGHFLLRGRIKNTINNDNTDLVHLEEVESALEYHPSVEDALVTRMMSDDGIERMVAHIVLGVINVDLSYTALVKEFNMFIDKKLGSGNLPRRYEFSMKIHCETNIEMSMDHLQSRRVNETVS